MSTTRRTVAGLAATITTHPLASTVARVLLLVALSMVMLSVLLLSTGHDVVAALSAMVRGAFGSYYAITSATIVRMVPLALAGLAVSVAFRAGLLNIGAEGQLLMGAAAATALSGALGGVRCNRVGCARGEERGALRERRDLQRTKRHCACNARQAAQRS